MVMATKAIIKEITNVPYFGLGISNKEVLADPKNWAKMIKETKGEIDQEPAFQTMLLDGGVKHPFDFDAMYQLYNSRSMIHGAIDKTVDATVSAGFTVTSEDKKAQELITDFLEVSNFKNILRDIVKDILICGNAFIEIVAKKNELPKLVHWSPTNFYVKRNKKKKITGYVQIVNKHSKKNILFDPKQIAHFTWNDNKDEPYGLGMIFPNLHDIDKEIGIEKSITTIMKRKGNQPIHVKMGSEEKPVQKADVDGMASKLHYMQDRTEYVTNNLVEMSVLDFGNIAEKFQPMLDHVHRNLLAGLQVPEVILTGWGNIAEGLAKVQLNTFRNERIRSIHEDIEETIEQQIFSIVLGVQNIGNIHVEFIWGDQSQEEKLKKLDEITKTLKLAQFGGISEDLRRELEIKVAELLDIDYEPPEPVEEPEEPMPEVPTPPEPEPEEVPKEADERLYEMLYKRAFGEKPCKCHEYRCFEKPENRYQISNEIELLEMGTLMGKSNEMSLKEYTRRDYSEFLPYTEAFILNYDFNEIKGLSVRQVGKLREVMITSLGQDVSVQQLADRIKSDVKVKPLQVKRVNLDGSKSTFQIGAERRADMIARTESVRVVNEGALGYYEKKKVKNVEWITHADERVCPVCAALEGSVYKVTEAIGLLPAHALCRCEMHPTSN